jgi:hypothetical protein
MSVSATASASDSAVQQMDVMIEDVHSRAAQMDEAISQVRDRCKGLVTAATKEAEGIVSQAKTDSEATRQEHAEWEAEKKRIATTHTFDPIVKLNVGGHSFTTTLATLTRYPDIMLGAMFSGRHALVKDENGAYFIDHDGTHFREILNFLRVPETYSTDAVPDRVKIELKVEADFYGLKDLMFPPPPIPPFAKAEPAAVDNAGGWSVTVTQDDAGLWYMEDGRAKQRKISRGTGTTVGNMCLVSVCDECGWGQPSGSTDYCSGIADFTTGRTITDAQPRKTETCNWDGDYCYCY